MRAVRRRGTRCARRRDRRAGRGEQRRARSRSPGCSAAANGGAVRAAIGHFAQPWATLARVPADDRRCAAAPRPVGSDRADHCRGTRRRRWSSRSSRYTLLAGSPASCQALPGLAVERAADLEALVRAGMPVGVVYLVQGGAQIGSALVADPRMRADLDDRIHADRTRDRGGRGAELHAAAARARIEQPGHRARRCRHRAHRRQSGRPAFLKLSGQWCEAPRRVYVARERAAELEEALVARLAQAARSVRAWTSASEVGPVAFAERRDRTAGPARRASRSRRTRRAPWARCPPRAGSSHRAGVIERMPDLAVEIFGPMLTVAAVDSDEEEPWSSRTPARWGSPATCSADDERPPGRLGDAPRSPARSRSTAPACSTCRRESAQSFFGASGLGRPRRRRCA